MKALFQERHTSTANDMVEIFPIIQTRRRFSSKCNVDDMIICKNFLNKDKST